MYLSYRDSIAELSIEEKGILLDAIFEYQLTGDVSEMPKLVKIIFSIMKQQFDRDNEKYQNIINRNRQNINKRWNKTDSKNTTGKSGKITYSDTDTDTDTDTDDVDVSDAGSGFAEIANFFESSSSYFPKVDLNDNSLRKQYYVMLKKHGIEKIKEAITNASQSWYCIGHNERASVVPLLWILTPKYFERLLSNEYKNKGKFPEFNRDGTRITDTQKKIFATSEDFFSRLKNEDNNQY